MAIVTLNFGEAAFVVVGMFEITMPAFHPTLNQSMKWT